jgi:hypothetical protein
MKVMEQIIMFTSCMSRDMLQKLIVGKEGDVTRDDVCTLYIKRITFNDL